MFDVTRRWPRMRWPLRRQRAKARRAALFPALNALAEWGIARVLGALASAPAWPTQLHFRLMAIRRPWGKTLIVRADLKR